jgi:hypothetical protein
VVTHLYWMPIFKWYMARFWVKNGFQKDMCYDEIGLCAQNIHTNLGWILNLIRMAYEITQKEGGSSNMIPDNFYISTLFVKLEMVVFMIYKIANWMRQFLFQSNGRNWLWISKCPQQDLSTCALWCCLCGSLK